MSFLGTSRDLPETQGSPLFTPFIVQYFWSWQLVDVFSLEEGRERQRLGKSKSSQCLIIIIDNICFSFFVVVGIELGVSCLVGRCFTTWATHPVLLFLVCFFS
jgi:hypothetical protein